MTDKIDVFKQNSIRIRCEKGNIYVDPFEMEESFNDASFVFITHDHFDHFSIDDIKKVINKDTILVIPGKMQPEADELLPLVKKIKVVDPSHNYEIDGLRFETVPAYNILKPFHVRSSGWVGYVIDTDCGRIYIAGDTDLTEEAKKVKCDTALVPIGGKYTMDAKKAAKLVNIIKPVTAIPVHYGSVVGSMDDAYTFKKFTDDDIKVEIRIK